MSSVKIHGDPKTEKKEMRLSLTVLATLLILVFVLFPWVYGAWLEPMIYDPWKAEMNNPTISSSENAQ
ncbi:hypothetical protein [Pseudodesulfovibrio sp. zrk46]|uniref:hypothetical protein n=1 Tax=Pseudodesulfovibrio sp. zrk46 TaxID=2725288 RepID=UPI00144906DE|nr:hypothetical protein [Pseudodesulfovibrio sp. zrk46]QJB56839.1 hypothetical protein HFN16_10670 [Pseudodesulfovibrio sp. zrk46]